MEKEKIIEIMIADDLFHGVKYFYQDDAEFKELTSVKEITMRILKCDPHLTIDNSRARPKIIN